MANAYCAHAPLLTLTLMTPREGQVDQLSIAKYERSLADPQEVEKGISKEVRREIQRTPARDPKEVPK